MKTPFQIKFQKNSTFLASLLGLAFFLMISGCSQESNISPDSEWVDISALERRPVVCPPGWVLKDSSYQTDSPTAIFTGSYRGGYCLDVHERHTFEPHPFFDFAGVIFMLTDKEGKSYSDRVMTIGGSFRIEVPAGEYQLSIPNYPAYNKSFNQAMAFAPGEVRTMEFVMQ